jgi:hypothetical protein
MGILTPNENAGTMMLSAVIAAAVAVAAWTKTGLQEKGERKRTCLFGSQGAKRHDYRHRRAALVGGRGAAERKKEVQEAVEEGPRPEGRLGEVGEGRKEGGRQGQGLK